MTKKGEFNSVCSSMFCSCETVFLKDSWWLLHENTCHPSEALYSRMEQYRGEGSHLYPMWVTMLDSLRNQWTALFQLSLPSAPLLVVPVQVGFVLLQLLGRMSFQNGTCFLHLWTHIWSYLFCKCGWGVSQDILTSDICYFNLWSPSASQLTFSKMSLAGLMCRACSGKTCTNSNGFGQFAHTAGFKVSRPALSQPRPIPAGTVRWQNQDPTNWE